MVSKRQAMKTTGKGRLVHIDRFLIRSQNLKRFRTRPLRYLDVGCGARKKGAPTTADTLNDFKKAGIKLELTAIDKGFPIGFKKHPGITFRRLNVTRKPITGQFEVVRYTNVELHLPEAEQKKTFENVANSVAEGGFLIFSHGPTTYQLFQKVSGKLVPLKTLKSKPGEELDRMNIALLRKWGMLP